VYGQTGPPELPSQQREGIGYPGPSTVPTLADRDPLGRQVQGQVGTARPEMPLYTGYTTGQEAPDDGCRSAEDYNFSK